MTAALILLDLQHDFLDRPGLTPTKDQLTTDCACLLGKWREKHLPVIHVHTEVALDGHNRMPHWQNSKIKECIEGSRGVLPPDSLKAIKHESKINKIFFSAFSNCEFEKELQHHSIKNLIIIGVFSHGCIRETVFDAYSRGYRCILPIECIGSYDILHHEISRDYMHGRAATFLPLQHILQIAQNVDHLDQPYVVTSLIASPVTDESPLSIIHDSPAEIDKKIREANYNFTKWSALTHDQRLEILRPLSSNIQKEKDHLIQLMWKEVAKNHQDAQEEINRTISTMEAIFEKSSDREHLSDHRIEYCAVGCTGIISPWNNPLAIPTSKIVTALLYGNSVIWKPALECHRISQIILDILLKLNLPQGLLHLIQGDSESARIIIKHPEINRITFTGSISAGKSIEANCAIHQKPLQAEMGGNNAVIIMSDADLDSTISDLSRSIFSYSGQRCTAIRRIIVENDILHELEKRLVSQAKKLLPDNSGLQLGPLVKVRSASRLKALIEEALQNGSTLLCGGTHRQGCAEHYFLPTLIRCDNPELSIVQTETFAPLAVIQPAKDLKEAIHLANHVEQGLLSGIISRNQQQLDFFTKHTQTGMVNIHGGRPAFHPEAPFSGWKKSHIGPPEHGRWDRDFYTQVKMIYQ